ncbi:MAG: FG-GAP repeat domain-containing protein [bacterium]
MGLKSLKVPQPEFSNWVIRRRQELNLSPACLREKLNHRLSERTLKYLEDGKKEAFCEYTLTTLAQGLNLSYPELLQQIEALQRNGTGNGVLTGNPRRNRLALFALPAVFLAVLIFAVLNGATGLLSNKGHGSRVDQFAPQSPGWVQDVLIHTDYPQIIMAFDAVGNKLWQKALKTKVKKAALLDLDQNGHKEVVAGTWKNNSSTWGDKPGWLFVWDENGDLMSEHNMWKPSIYPAQEPQKNILDFQQVDLEKDGIQELVVAIRGVEYYPSRLAVLHYQNRTFKEVKTFWNPGYLTKLVIEDIDGDGFPEIFCAAVNNDFKRVPAFNLPENVYAMFMLQGRSIYGQAPPYLGNAPKGSQVWYRYVTPPSAVNPAGAILGVRISGEREKEIHVKMKDSCFFYLNYNGEIVDRFSGDDCKGETELHLIPNEATW